MQTMNGLEVMLHIGVRIDAHAVVTTSALVACFGDLSISLLMHLPVFVKVTALFNAQWAAVECILAQRWG